MCEKVSKTVSCGRKYFENGEKKIAFKSKIDTCRLGLNFRTVIVFAITLYIRELQHGRRLEWAGYVPPRVRLHWTKFLRIRWQSGDFLFGIKEVVYN